jgi:SWI/SNF-related matrix-associated actin-dependent regulator of chromatin subfamily A member 5
LFSEDEDMFLVQRLQRFGCGASAWDRIRLEICRHETFRFDWFLKSRSAKELQTRSEEIVRLIEREAKGLLLPPPLAPVEEGGPKTKKRKAQGAGAGVAE